MKALMTLTTFILFTMLTTTMANHRPTSPSKVPLTSSEFEVTLIDPNDYISSIPFEFLDLLMEESKQDENARYSLYGERYPKSNPTLDLLYLSHPPPVSV